MPAKISRKGKRRSQQPIVLRWKWRGHISGNRCVTMHRCEEHKAQREKWCNRRQGSGPMGFEYYGGGTSFFLDDDKREYKTEKQLIAAIRKRQNTDLKVAKGAPAK